MKFKKFVIFDILFLFFLQTALLKVLWNNTEGTWCQFHKTFFIVTDAEAK
jgi:hypothetical protein